MHCIPFSLSSPLSLVVPATDFLLPWFPALAILDGNTGFFQARLNLGPTTAIPFLVGFLFGFSSLGSPSAVPDREGVHPKPSSNPSAPQLLSYLNPSLWHPRRTQFLFLFLLCFYFCHSRSHQTWTDRDVPPHAHARICRWRASTHSLSVSPIRD